MKYLFIGISVLSINLFDCYSMNLFRREESGNLVQRPLLDGIQLEDLDGNDQRAPAAAIPPHPFHTSKNLPMRNFLLCWNLSGMLGDVPNVYSERAFMPIFQTNPTALFNQSADAIRNFLNRPKHYHLRFDLPSMFSTEFEDRNEVMGGANSLLAAMSAFYPSIEGRDFVSHNTHLPLTVGTREGRLLNAEESAIALNNAKERFYKARDYLIEILHEAQNAVQTPYFDERFSCSRR